MCANITIKNLTRSTRRNGEHGGKRKRNEKGKEKSISYFVHFSFLRVLRIPRVLCEMN